MLFVKLGKNEKKKIIVVNEICLFKTKFYFFLRAVLNSGLFKLFERKILFFSRNTRFVIMRLCPSPGYYYKTRSLADEENSSVNEKKWSCVIRQIVFLFYRTRKVHFLEIECLVSSIRLMTREKIFAT